MARRAGQPDANQGGFRQPDEGLDGGVFGGTAILAQSASMHFVGIKGTSKVDSHYKMFKY